ncbi:MAG: aminopeptidase P family protein [Desulfobacteraceae bacterium]|nr:aminopeptidase P family protein [Desulfobacteraceae bacterium]MBC2756525.1 aminopeptidase P family protein [Desulfobacteraceae bacterium]
MENSVSQRISQLRKQIAKQQIDTFLVLIEENRRYLSGYTGEDTQFDESAGVLIITQDELILATDSRFELQAQEEAPLYDVVCYKKGLVKELPAILRQLKTKRLGIEGLRMSYNQYVKICQELELQNLTVKLIDTVHLVEDLRVIKDDDEIKAIIKAVEVAECDFQAFLQQLKKGVKETDAAWELEKKMRAAGAQALSFPVISAFGKNSALPHAIPGNRTLNANEPVLFDWGAKLNGYCSDMTRTVTMGKPDDQFNKIFTIVYDAQQKAIEAIRPGVSSKSIDDIARNHIAEKGFKDFFGHGLGHGVGLAVHEPPSISPLIEKDITIKENMVFTVEPGIYLPDWGGIRLENMVLVTINGIEVLNLLEMELFISESD